MPSIGTIFLAFLNFNRAVPFVKFLPEKKVGAREFGFFGFSRSAISLVFIAKHIQNKRKKNKITVWIPDYFCNMSLELLRLENVDLYFYQTVQHGAPNFLMCQEALQNSKPDLFILVHYFGRSQVMSLVRKAYDFCEKNGSYLIEDYVHKMNIPEGRVLGDFALRSPHKYLPIPDGAYCMVNPNGPMNKYETWQSLKNELSNQYSQLSVVKKRKDYSVLVWAIKRLIQKSGLALLASNLREASGSSILTTRHFLLSSIPNYTSLQYLISGKKNFKKILQKRSLIHLTWVKNINSLIPKKYIVPDLGRGIYSCKIKIEHEFQDFFVNIFKNLRCKLEKWPDLPPEVMVSSRHYEYAKCEYEGNFFLPCNQDIRTRSIQNLVKRVHQSIASSYCISAISKIDYDCMYEKIEGASYIQHSIYAESISEEKKLDVEYLLIKDLSGAPVAIVQVLKKRILGLFNIYRVNRGPLFFTDQQIDAPEIAVILTLLKRCLAKESRGLLYIAPDIQYSEALVDLFSNIGFKYRKNKSAWESAYIEIDLDESQILDRMSGRWRNSLKKALKHNLNLKNLTKYDSISQFLKLYEYNKLEKSFAGVSTKRVLDFLHESSVGSGISIFIANVKNHDDSISSEEILGGVAIIYAGGVATYLIGVSKEEGRRKNVNTLLLWTAILKAKELGCKKFDLGGLGDKTPNGIAKFKRGLNPMPYKLIGEFWSWI